VGLTHTQAGQRDVLIIPSWSSIFTTSSSSCASRAVTRKCEKKSSSAMLLSLDRSILCSRGTEQYRRRASTVDGMCNWNGRAHSILLIDHELDRNPPALGHGVLAVGR
jgi:hypothetical protein